MRLKGERWRREREERGWCWRTHGEHNEGRMEKQLEAVKKYRCSCCDGEGHSGTNAHNLREKEKKGKKPLFVQLNSWGRI